MLLKINSFVWSSVRDPINVWSRNTLMPVSWHLRVKRGVEVCVRCHRFGSTILGFQERLVLFEGFSSQTSRCLVRDVAVVTEVGN